MNAQKLYQTLEQDFELEKFACIAMVEYFKKLGLPSGFIQGEPDLNDLE